MALQLTSTFLLLASCATVMTAQSVHLFGDTNFGLNTGHWLFEFSMMQFCNNTVAFNDKASSTQWRDLPQTENFTSNQAFIAFYTDRPHVANGGEKFPNKLRARRYRQSDIVLHGMEDK
ncbi:hypothetical protein JG688_00005933 [Phytophthora aleatoria]|uniref:Uncharacterized protein n=1 Tax=Phytophthora aleatoria TaxID=2496075 RepID=A0A8J5MHB9_9STRA|nr:hypothetical protein JG688_00005933 [Phytophthora aleatoria]